MTNQAEKGNLADAVTGQDINLYPSASLEDRARLVPSSVDDGACVSFVFQSPSRNKSESNRKRHMTPPPETTRQDNPRE